MFVIVLLLWGGGGWPPAYPYSSQASQASQASKDETMNTSKDKTRITNI